MSGEKTNEIRGGNGDETTGKDRRRPSRLPARDQCRRGAAAAAAPLATSAQADSENNDEKRKARYQATDHVKAFYRVNRYPS